MKHLQNGNPSLEEFISHEPPLVQVKGVNLQVFKDDSRLTLEKKKREFDQVLQTLGYYYYAWEGRDYICKMNCWFWYWMFNSIPIDFECDWNIDLYSYTDFADVADKIAEKYTEIFGRQVVINT